MGEGKVESHGSNILSTHIPFVPCQSARPFLRYSIFKIWPWKSKVKVMGEVGIESHNMGPTFYWLISLYFHDNRPSHSWLWLFQNLTLKIQGQGHGWGERWKSQSTRVITMLLAGLHIAQGLHNKAPLFIDRLHNTVCNWCSDIVWMPTTLRINAWTDFHEFFRICWAWYMEHSKKIWSFMLNPLGTGFLFPCFQGNPCLLATLRENDWTEFHDISAKFGYDTGNNLEHFRDVLINPLLPGPIFLFPGFVLVSNIMEK